jgi:Domain of unknown function (DUF4178)
MVAFEHPSSNLKVCTCGSVLQKINNELKADNSLNNVTVKGYHIKPGTTGEWEKKQFKVLGKMGVWYEESFYSYWFIVFNDGSTGFLAEGSGMYSILVSEKNPVIKNSDLANNKIGQVVTLTDYQLQKKNNSYYWEVEGELWLDNYSAFFDVYEYAGESGRFFTIFKWANNVADAYHNNPVSFDALNLNNIQEVNPLGKELKCPQCFKAIKMITYPLAQSCTCNSCGTFYAIEKNQPDKKGNNSNNLFEPLLALGTKGVLKGVSYEVVGYVKKQEQNAYKSKWKEYVLFNSIYGFAFLSEYDGHWIFLKETILCPVILNDNTKEFEFANESFHLFNSYTYSVIEAKGEFPYNIFDNKNTLVKEYISPPEIWIREKDNREGITWFFGEHISIKEITSAFAVTATVPYRKGIGAVQPTNYINIKKLVTITLVAIVALLLIHLLLISNKQNKVITEENYYFTDSADNVKVVTEKFDFNKWRSNVAFTISAPVNNSWFELNATLVNAVTGEEYSLQKGVEYYYGYSGGESWTEGSTDETAYITNIPSGKYFLQMEGVRESNLLNKPNNFSVKAVYDAVDYRNFWFAVLLVLIWPVINYIISNQKEKSRWGNSPFSNYNSN